jgi:hypothetical protein
LSFTGKKPFPQKYCDDDKKASSLFQVARLWNLWYFTARQEMREALKGGIGLSCAFNPEFFRQWRW